MSDNHVLDELSAYIDGEAGEPELIARHLAKCTTCAERHETLLNLATRVQALPPPPPRADFVAAVLERVEAEAQAKARPRITWRFAWPAPVLAAAAAVLLVLALSLQSSPPVTPPDLASGVPTAPSAPAAWWAEEEAVESEFARLLDAGADVSWLELAVYQPSEPLASFSLDVDEIMVMLADASAGVVYPELETEPDDLHAALDAMSPEEMSILQELIQEYIREG
jgi:anti-sigma factor RsiW